MCLWPAEGATEPRFCFSWFHRWMETCAWTVWTLKYINILHGRADRKWNMRERTRKKQWKEVKHNWIKQQINKKKPDMLMIKSTWARYIDLLDFMIYLSKWLLTFSSSSGWNRKHVWQPFIFLLKIFPTISRLFTK